MPYAPRRSQGDRRGDRVADEQGEHPAGELIEPAARSVCRRNRPRSGRHRACPPCRRARSAYSTCPRAHTRVYRSSTSALSPVPVMSITSMPTSASLASWVRSSVASAASRTSVSVPVPPSIRAKPPSRIVTSSSPAPQYSRSAPPTPASVSSPSPATIASAERGADRRVRARGAEMRDRPGEVAAKDDVAAPGRRAVARGSDDEGPGNRRRSHRRLRSPKRPERSRLRLTVQGESSVPIRNVRQQHRRCVGLAEHHVATSAVVPSRIGIVRADDEVGEPVGVDVAHAAHRRTGAIPGRLTVESEPSDSTDDIRKRDRGRVGPSRTPRRFVPDANPKGSASRAPMTRSASPSPLTSPRAAHRPTRPVAVDLAVEDEPADPICHVGQGYQRRCPPCRTRRRSAPRGRDPEPRRSGRQTRRR